MNAAEGRGATTIEGGCEARTIMGKAGLLACVALMLVVTTSRAEKPSARDSGVVQSCIKSAGDDRQQLERCIGGVADPCAEKPDAQSTADQVACADRERAVWDDILNETFRRLREHLDAKQKIKLRDMQRAWIESRNRTCDFYWDFFQGTMASPMSAFCYNRETARRALFLLAFLNTAESR
jgi:uncharacterized protein YecT (DUF1311 family)